MKVCKKHLKLCTRGTTVEIVEEKDCIVCKDPTIKKVEELW